jgi:hypothetical protein
MIYLYLKKHNKTGLKYLGKTISNDPYSYQGSGKVWRRHIEKQSKHTSSLKWCNDGVRNYRKPIIPEDMFPGKLKY